jgi:hypothetical protein
LIIYFNSEINLGITQYFKEVLFMGTKRNFVPADPKLRDMIEEIQKRVCASGFMDRFRYNLYPGSFDIYTVTVEFLTALSNVYLASDIETVSIGDIIVITKTYRRKAAEKDGSINGKVELGEIGREIQLHGEDGFVDRLEDDIEMRKMMLAAGALASKMLVDYNVGSMKPEDIYHITIAFLSYMIIFAEECAGNQNIDEQSFSLIIGGDLNAFNLKFKRHPGGVNTLHFICGPIFKLGSKNDAKTEA